MKNQFWGLSVGYMTIIKQISSIQQYVYIWQYKFALSELLGVMEGKMSIVHGLCIKDLSTWLR